MNVINLRIFIFSFHLPHTRKMQGKYLVTTSSATLDNPPHPTLRNITDKKGQAELRGGEENSIKQPPLSVQWSFLCPLT